MNTIDYKDTTRVKPATRVSMRVNAYTRVIFMRVKRVSHAFNVELLAGLYRSSSYSNVILCVHTL